MLRAFLKKVGFLTKKKANLQPKIHSTPRIIPRNEHGISRKDISKNALKVLYRLHQCGYDAYLVGGSVRDLLLGLHPKDFDVVTNAKPEEVRRVFSNCRLIGRRFRLAHIYFGREIVEVATFRGKQADEASHSEQGMILRDNVYGTIVEDAWRRDFTINALYYNIADFSVVDYTNGFNDLKAKRLQMIGDAKQRYREDPVRMLRAIRFACKVNFVLPPSLTQSMKELKTLIRHVPAARLFEEMIKLFHSGIAYPVYQLLKQHHLFAELFPLTAECLSQKGYPTDHWLTTVFKDTDYRLSQQQSVMMAFIVAALLWPAICLKAAQYQQQGMDKYAATIQATEKLLSAQNQRLSIPKRIAYHARDIWLLQLRFIKRTKAPRLVEEPLFRAALDFLVLRAKAGEPVQKLAQWWQTFAKSSQPTRRKMLATIKTKKPKRAANESDRSLS